MNPRGRVIPAYAGTYPEAPCDNRPLRGAPPLPYAVSMTPRSNPTTDGRPLPAAPPFGLIPASKAPKTPQTSLKPAHPPAGAQE